MRKVIYISFELSKYRKIKKIILYNFQYVKTGNSKNMISI